MECSQLKKKINKIHPTLLIHPRLGLDERTHTHTDPTAKQVNILRSLRPVVQQRESFLETPHPT